MLFDRNFIYLLIISTLIGIANECIAYSYQLWIYHPWWMTFVNLVLMFMIVMPLYARTFFDASYWNIYFGGVLIGLCYEMLDELWLGWATFPEHQLIEWHNIIAIRFGIALLWGLVPFVTVFLTKFFYKLTS